jgi:hypothetical protein
MRNSKATHSISWRRIHGLGCAIADEYLQSAVPGTGKPVAAIRLEVAYGPRSRSAAY